MNFRNLVPFFLIFLQISKNECSTIVKKQIGRLGPDDIIGDIVDAVTSRKNNFQVIYFNAVRMIHFTVHIITCLLQLLTHARDQKYRALLATHLPG